MSRKPGLLLLDRDGVLNAMVVDPEHGTIDSPLHPSQVQMKSGVAKALKELGEMGYKLAIVTNQPAAAKGKTTKANLEAVHAEVLRLAQSEGAVIASSHICFHRSEDGCSCRKPKTGLLEEAFARHAEVDRARSLMVGDGVTDVQAGQKMGLRTVFIAPRKADQISVLFVKTASPTFWVESLPELVGILKEEKS